jgi:hypothetical protein
MRARVMAAICASGCESGATKSNGFFLAHKPCDEIGESTARNSEVDLFRQ